MATAVDSGRIMTPMAGFVNTDTRLAEEVVTQGLSRDLEAFYNKTNSPRDQAKALELLTSIRLGQEIRDSQPRPYTAMPSLGGRRDPYETTYHRDFPQKESSARAIRPMTSRGFQATHDLGGPVGDTTYVTEYAQKPAQPGTPVRSGSASGNRANKPHPLQSFMIWRFPAKTIPENKQPWSEELTDDKISQVHKRLCQSTYQSDFLGIPQGFQVKDAYNLPPDWKANIPYTLDSVARYSYQQPMQQAELQLPTSRYGSNKKKNLPASGTIPTASSRYMHIKQRTTYDRHYNENADAVVTQIRDIGRKLGVDALRKHYEKATGEQKEMIGRVLAAYKTGATPPPPARCAPTPPPPRPPSYNARRSHVPACTPISDFNGNQGHYKAVSTPSDYAPNYNEDGIEIPNGHVPNLYNPGANFMRENPTPRTPVVHDNPPIRVPDSPWRPARTPSSTHTMNMPYTPPVFLS